ncbi:MAG: YlxR family protein [Clostridia bacterium]|nr:YlxR family protein [Clostridia bacterium]
MKQKKIPLRKCTGCNEMKPKKELIRVVKLPDTVSENGEVLQKGNIELDFTGKKPGRGAYICPSMDCLNKAIKGKRLERAFSSAIPTEVYENLKEALLKGE